MIENDRNSIADLGKRNYDKICQEKFEDVKNESCPETDSDLDDKQPSRSENKKRRRSSDRDSK